MGSSAPWPLLRESREQQPEPPIPDKKAETKSECDVKTLAYSFCYKTKGRHDERPLHQPSGKQHGGITSRKARESVWNLMMEEEPAAQMTAAFR